MKKSMDFFKKAAIGIIIGTCLLILVFSAISKMDENTETRSLTIKNNNEISLNSRRLASQTASIAPFKTMDVYLSKEESPDFEFTSVGGTWDEIAPEGTNVEIEVRFKVDQKWTNWLALDEEEDLIQDYEDLPGSLRKFAMASSNSATAFQYKVLMYGDGITVPKVNNMDWTFIKAGRKINIKPAPQPQYSSFQPVSNSTYLSLTSTSSGVISRSGWGADESYRYLENNDSETVLIDIPDETYEKFKDELTFSRVVEKDSNGKEYKWPLQYPVKVKKFIIHHTATTQDLDNPSQAIRDIYYYHSVTKGWGDIGYNYVVDKNGRIYEGRYGGEGVIGAHAGIANNGSIGIAVLGNFETNEVPQTIVTALGKFIAQKAQIHSIDPTAYSSFRGSSMPNIFGHKDVMNTTCPGIYLYEKLPIIRSLAKNYMTQQKQKYIYDYDYQDISNIYYLELSPDQTVDVTIKLENIGKMDWNSDTFIVVNNDPAFEGVISFPGSDPIKLAMMEESNVKPGEIGTFKFKIKAGKKGDTVNLNIAPLMNGTKKSKDYVIIPVSIQQVDYKYEFVRSTYPPKSMDKGQEFTAEVMFKNTGNITWRKSGENTVTLGTDHERDRISKFIPSYAPLKTRMGYLKEDQVAPGEIGTFVMNLKAPDEAGYYKEYFTPVVEGVTWMRDSGMYFETTVFGELYVAQVEKITASKEWERGEKYLVMIKLRNLGKNTWTKNNFKIVLLKETDLEITDSKLLVDKVEPGDMGTLSFVAEVAEDEELERKPLLVRPMVNGSHLLRRPIYLHYYVKENTKVQNIKTLQEKWESNSQTASTNTSSGSEEDIRVKISYSGEPQITASGSFDIYSGNNYVTTLNAAQTAEVKLSNLNFQITADNNSYSKAGPIRFIPKSGSILEIKNFTNRPEWNPSLNDNKYRGILEIQKVDGQLTVINELPLEDYLKGLGEVPNDEEFEKIKAIMVAARTYAKFYMDKDEKFPDKPYDLDDDPNVCQKYLGYGFESRAPNIVSAVALTKGEVVTYNDELVKTPYFSQSDGTYTKTPEEVWGWSAPHLKSVSDSYCDGEEFWGHGVGLSGCGARGMAQNGFNYKEILKHYYTGIEITDLY